MRILSLLSLSLILYLVPALLVAQEGGTATVPKEVARENGPNEMLVSLLDLQNYLNEQLTMQKKKLKASSSASEKEALELEIAQIDRQLSETVDDFERIATGVEIGLFTEKKEQAFSWKEEMALLVEPAIKELKRFTIRARQKSDLKERIADLELKAITAGNAVRHLEELQKTSGDKRVVKEVAVLLPEWRNAESRLNRKAELAKGELASLSAQDISLVESSSRSIRDFFRARGLYLIIAVSAFFIILFGCRLLHKLLVKVYLKVGKRDQRSFRVRLFDLILKVLSVVLAVVGLFFVLYMAEDWFLLSGAIIFFLGLGWTIRQGLPRYWQQARLMLNVGSVRENERIVLHGVPWRVEAINVFCTLQNPALDMELRVPIENLVGLVSRPYKPEEPWFPCRRGDWVVVGGNSRARVVSISSEQVELVERGGRRITYPTDVFLQACPANLSRNFRLRIPFGLSYNLQERVTTDVPAIMLGYISRRMEEDGHSSSCLNLQVEFLTANASSLDLMVLADFEGKVADISARLDRAIQRYCVDCCTEQGWEIPFPQLTVHRAG